MASLHDLVRDGMVHVGDQVEFTFKGNHFTSRILRGGLLGDFFLQKTHESVPSKVLANTIAFNSLTAWTEACLQDVLEEYYTRYSSWKRVYHVNSRRSMGDIRDQHKLTKDAKGENVLELYKEILRLQQIIGEMNAYIRTLSPESSCRQWEFLRIAEVSPEHKTPPGFTTPIDEDLHARAQEQFCATYCPVSDSVPQSPTVAAHPVSR